MDHEILREKLMEYRDEDFPASERDEISGHLKNCSECQEFLRSWEQIAALSKQGSFKHNGDWFVNQVISRIEALETPHAKPGARWSLPKWLVPVAGYSFALFLMYLAIAHRELPVTMETVLLADVPGNSQWVFSGESPDTEILGVSQEGL